MKRINSFFALNVNFWNVVFILLFSIAIFTVYLTSVLVTSAGAGADNAIMKSFISPLIVVSCLFVGGGLIQRIKNPRLFYWLVMLLIIPNIIVGVTALWIDAPVGVVLNATTFSIILAMLIPVGMILNATTFSIILALFIFAGVDGYFFIMTLLFLFIELALILSGFSQDAFRTTPGIFIAFAMIMSLAMYPRRMNFASYFFPRRKRYPYTKQQSEGEQGFTLIELLIVVAIMGIMATGALHVWAGLISAQKENELRAQVQNVMDAQMSALHQQLERGEEFGNTLPIPLSEFVLPESLSGGVKMEETENSALVQLTVQFTLDVPGEYDRHFRLVSFARKGESDE